MKITEVMTQQSDTGYRKESNRYFKNKGHKEESKDAQTGDSVLEENPLSLPIKKENMHETGQQEYLFVHVAKTDDDLTICKQSIKTRKDVKIFLKESWEQTLLLFKSPHLRPTVLTCLIQFGLIVGYYTLMMWFPELFNRFDKFEELHPNETPSVCIVSSVFHQEPTGLVTGNRKKVFHEEKLCDATSIDRSVYLHTLVIGLTCIPTSFWLPLCVHRLGIKFFLSKYINSNCDISNVNALQNLILSCIFEALASLAISVVYCIMVDLFPTQLSKPRWKD
ncbi:uncharacterized protein LOC142319842 [Lycorma delicatula]|uniref:uncharacterized protein LOC142319842 n=1 Tax=Lycorma delicatula TaxID=130591 RepID=UPI003F517811